MKSIFSIFSVKQFGKDSEGKAISLPSISLIITYKNEPRSTLLRTIVSVFERTSPDLLKEIIYSSKVD